MLAEKLHLGGKIQCLKYRLQLVTQNASCILYFRNVFLTSISRSKAGLTSFFLTRDIQVALRQNISGLNNFLLRSFTKHFETNLILISKSS